MEDSVLRAALVASLLVLVCKLILELLRAYWWTPHVVSNLLIKQGFKGPTPHFFSGNADEIGRLSKLVLSRDMENINHDIVSRMLPYLTQWLKVYGEKIYFWWGREPGIFVAKADLVKEVCNSKEVGGPYAKIRVRYRSRTALFGDGLFTLTGEAWVHRRSLVAPAFHQETVKGLVADMVNCSEKMVNEWEALTDEDGNVQFDVFEEYKKLTANIIACTAFGSSYEKGKKIFEQIELVQRLVAETDYSSMLGKSFLPTTTNRKIWKGSKEINRTLQQSVEERRETVLSGRRADYGNDLLGRLLQNVERSSREGGSRLTLQNVIDECKTFYFAGNETTALLLTWTTMLLSLHPEWQERAREEATEATASGNLTYEKLIRMKTVGIILNETLRLYPPSSLAMRRAMKETKLGGMTIPKGLTIWLPIVALHHDEDLWGPDAHEFRPERFAGGAAKAGVVGAAGFMPFGHGPRSCLGASFALLETKAALALVLSRYSVCLAPSYRHAPVSVLTTRPLHGMPVVLRKLAL